MPIAAGGMELFLPKIIEEKGEIKHGNQEKEK